MDNTHQVSFHKQEGGLFLLLANIPKTLYLFPNESSGIVQKERNQTANVLGRDLCKLEASDAAPVFLRLGFCLVMGQVGLFLSAMRS